MNDELRVTAGDGVELFARTYGLATDRPTLVCLPGLTRNSRDFADLATAFAADRLVVTPDLRGRGESGYDTSGETYRPDVYVDDVVTVLDRAGVDRAVLLGTSLGGAVAMQFAGAHPERVVGLVLNDVGPKLEAEGFAIQSYADSSPASSWMTPLCNSSSSTHRWSAPSTTTLGTAWLSSGASTRRVNRPDDPAVATGMATVDPAEAIPSTWPLFDKIIRDVPMLVLRGAVSDLFATTTVDEMQRRSPTLRGSRSRTWSLSDTRRARIACCDPRVPRFVVTPVRDCRGRGTESSSSVATVA